MYTEDSLPNSIKGATQLMLSQRDKGIAKYGQPIEKANLTAEELLQHAREEMADGSVYLTQLHAQFKHDLQREYGRAIHDMRELLEAAGLMTEDVSNALASGQFSMLRTTMRCYLAPEYAEALNRGDNLLTISMHRIAQYTVPADIILP